MSEIYKKGDKDIEPGFYFEYSLNKEHLIAKEIIANGYIPNPTDQQTAIKIGQALKRDFDKELRNTYERNRINIYIVQNFLDLFLYQKQHGEKLHPEIAELLKDF